MQWIFDRIPGRLLLSLIGTAILLPLGFLPEPKAKPRRVTLSMIQYSNDHAKSPGQNGASDTQLIVQQEHTK